MKRGLNHKNSLPDPEFGGESSESARAIHYVVQKDTLMTYVSALEAQADPGIVSGSTIERKKMSTKTIYKRIALVAVAALGMGVLTSVSPANAGTNTKIFCDLADGLADQTGPTATNDVCNGVAGPANFVRLQWHNTGAAPAAGERLTLSGAAATFSNPTDAAKVSVPLSGLTATVVSDPTGETILVNTPTAGTVTVSRFAAPTGGVYSTTAVETVVITVNAAKVSGSIDLATSTAVMNKAATWSSTTETTSTSASATANTTGTPVFAVKVSLGQVAGAITTTTKVAVSLAGPGTLAVNSDDADPLNGGTSVGTGRSLTSTVATTGEVFTVGVAPDGVAGVSTLTITVGTYTATKTITFVGVVASLAVTAVRGSIPDTADGTANSDTDGYAAVITGKDAAGNTVTLTESEFTEPTAAELTAAVVTGATVEAAVAATYSGVVVAANAPVLVVDPTATKTGVKSLTLKHTATGLTVVVPFTVGLVRATTAVLTTDKATYLPGEKITLTLTLKDAGGFKTADDGTGTNVLAAGGITSNVSLVGDTTTAVDVPTIGGVKTWTLYAPLASGPIVFAGKTGAGSGVPATAVTLAATATVSASADATANAAAVATLTTLVNSLIAKINALNKLVIKIQKKVRA
jgi:trimeric autotransporter adhesin